MEIRKKSSAKMEEQFSDDPLDCAFVEMELPKGWQQGRSDKEQLRHRGRVRHAGTKLPLKDKIAHAMKVIESAYNREEVTWALSYSGGADSTVVSHIVVQQMGLKPIHVFADTRLEYSSPRRQVTRWRKWLRQRKVELVTVRSDKRPLEVWQDGLPIGSKMVASKARQYQATGNERHLARLAPEMRKGIIAATEAGWPISEKCCDILKKKPMMKFDREHHITGHITGQRVQEAEARKLAWLQRGALYHSSRNRQWLCHPLAYWTTADVVAYMANNRVPFEGRSQEQRRSGCSICGFGCHLDKYPEENTIQSLARYHPKMYNDLACESGMVDCMDLMGIPTAPWDFR